MISVIHLAADDDIEAAAATALAAFARRPGYRRGTLGRSTDDESAWVIVTEWRDVGSYRRAIGHADLKLHAAPLFAQALDQPSAFEALVSIVADGAADVTASDREPTP
jgi:hypothetical protein